jgi:hypothetical protein
MMRTDKTPDLPQNLQCAQDRTPSREIAAQSLLPGRRSGLKSGFDSLSEPILWLASWSENPSDFLPKTGLEPAHPLGYKNLNLVCLPISPPGHMATQFTAGCPFRSSAEMRLEIF